MRVSALCRVRALAPATSSAITTVATATLLRRAIVVFVLVVGWLIGVRGEGDREGSDGPQPNFF